MMLPLFRRQDLPDSIPFRSTESCERRVDAHPDRKLRTTSLSLRPTAYIDVQRYLVHDSE